MIITQVILKSTIRTKAMMLRTITEVIVIAVITVVTVMVIELSVKNNNNKGNIKDSKMILVQRTIAKQNKTHNKETMKHHHRQQICFFASPVTRKSRVHNVFTD